MPMITADCVIVKNNRVLLIKRTYPPFRGSWTITGGFVDYREPLRKAAAREAKEETGLKIKIIDMVGIYDDPRRDPRGSLVSVVFLGKPVGGKLTVNEEASDLRFFDPSKLPVDIGFDHRKIIKDAFKLLRPKKGTPP